jgi:hypothetical protein
MVEREVAVHRSSAFDEGHTKPPESAPRSLGVSRRQSVDRLKLCWAIPKLAYLTLCEFPTDVAAVLRFAVKVWVQIWTQFSDIPVDMAVSKSHPEGRIRGGEWITVR